MKLIRKFLDKFVGYHKDCICNDSRLEGYGWTNDDFYFYWNGYEYIKGESLEKLVSDE